MRRQRLVHALLFTKTKTVYICIPAEWTLALCERHAALASSASRLPTNHFVGSLKSLPCSPTLAPSWLVAGSLLATGLCKQPHSPFISIRQINKSTSLFGEMRAHCGCLAPFTAIDEARGCSRGNANSIDIVFVVRGVKRHGLWRWQGNFISRMFQWVTTAVTHWRRGTWKISF